MFLVVGESRAAFVDPFLQFGDQERDIGGDFRSPASLESRRRKFALLGAKVEPRSPNVGAVEGYEGVAAFDILTQHRMDLAHDAGGTRTHLELAIRVDLDHPDDRNPGRNSIEPRRLDRDLGLLEFEVRLRDRRAAGRGGSLRPCFSVVGSDFPPADVWA